MRRALLLASLVALAGCGSSGSEVSVPRAQPTIATVPGGAEGGGTAPGTSPTTTTPAPRAAVPRPPIVQRRIPYGARRRADMAAYSLRHYGVREWRLSPRAIVEHYTGNGSFSATWNTFAPNMRDPELHELPGTCAHFVVATSGTIYQLVDTAIRCRHAFGVNHAAIGIEHVGYSDGQVMGNSRQLAASLALTRWLRCRYGIAVRDVIGHAETLASPWYVEIHPERHGRSTHGDMARPAMTRYRARLTRLPCA
jgi:beta-N-acetylhexosaminidase